MWMRGLVMSCCMGLAVAQQAPPLDLAALLQRYVDTDWMWTPPVPGERCLQFSSFDRRSLAGPADPVAFYANDDRGHYLRKETRDGQAEFVLADVDGPGCVARIWSANPAGTLHFDIDGERVWSVDFAALCAGRVEHVPAPLAAMRAQGGNVYLPVPFQRRLVLSATDAKLYYHVDVVTWPAGTPVTSFSPDQLTTQWPMVRELAFNFPQARPAYDHDLMLVDDRTPQPPAGTRRIGAQHDVLVVPRGSLVTGFRVDLGPGLTPAERAEVLARVLLVVRCGDEQTVRVPLPDFFAAGPDWVPHDSRFLTVTADGASSAFPMPMPDGGEIRLECEAELGAFRPRLRHAFVRELGAAPALRFRASYHLQKGQPTRPFGDHLVLDASGPGRFVGMGLVIRNPSRTWWGEGDEKITVDGEAFPSWFGTGTEDYFGFAWCDPTPFVAPLHGQVQCDGPRNHGFSAMYRFHGLDSVPFQRSLRFDLERWHWVERLQVDYATVAFWYGAPGARGGLPPVPSYAERELAKLPPPKTLVVAGALEGETLRVLRCSGGAHAVQDLAFFEGQFSQDQHLWWRDGKVGDELVLVVPVATAGRYRVRAAFVRAEDFGIVQLTLAAVPLGQPFDGYADHISASGELSFGEFELTAGDNELALRIVGKHTNARPGHMVGLDYLLLEPVR
ncbi:MAG: DUF2961 domain-containing protein [Planctomycetes bacterium]|nr:DUF2961 domain-containing protein [Planctomycetota bacterium]